MKLKRTFLNTWDEWHATVLGWSAAVCPYKSEHLETQKARRLIMKEPWYFGFGLVMGVVTWFGLITITLVIWGVI